MDNQKTKGLYVKFNVSRMDGRDKPGGDRNGAEYFVLDLTHDKHARAALLAYAASCRYEYPALSRDLFAKCKDMPETGRMRERYTEDPEREWQEFWSDIVAPGGVVDVDQLKKELCDFSMLMHHAAIVYEHATGGMISKPNTLPSVVCGVIDDHVTELCEEAAKEAREEADAAPASANAQPVPHGWKLVPDFQVGMIVKFGGEEYKIFANGNRPGTFDICHPTDDHRDRWLNVPPDQLEPLSVPGASKPQPCNHVFEARPIDGSTSANVSCEPVCRKCGYRPAVKAQP